MGITRAEFGEMADEVQRFADYTGQSFAAAVKALTFAGLRATAAPDRDQIEPESVPAPWTAAVPNRYRIGPESGTGSPQGADGEGTDRYRIGTETGPQHSAGERAEGPDRYRIGTQAGPSPPEDGTETVPDRDRSGPESSPDRENPRARERAVVGVDVEVERDTSRDTPNPQLQLPKEQALTPQQAAVADVRRRLDETGALDAIGLTDERRLHQTLALWLKKCAWQPDAVVATVEDALVAAREADDPVRYLHGCIRRREKRGGRGGGGGGRSGDGSRRSRGDGDGRGSPGKGGRRRGQAAGTAPPTSAEWEAQVRAVEDQAEGAAEGTDEAAP